MHFLARENFLNKIVYRNSIHTNDHCRAVPAEVGTEGSGALLFCRLLPSPPQYLAGDHRAQVASHWYS